MEEIKIGISACLLGEKVRYDGGHKLDQYIKETLGQYFEWVPVCPEVEYGLPTPREAMHLTGSPETARLVTIRSGVDYTAGMLSWTAQKLKALKKDDLCGFIFKSRSPSSGIGGVKVYSDTGVPSRRGTGIFGGAFIRHFPHLPVSDEGRLHDPELRENFIERVFVYKRWKDLVDRGGAIRDLIDFHTEHKYLILSHSPRHYSLLGRLVAHAKGYKPGELLSQYIDILTEALQLIATVKKNTSVLLHIAGYFKKLLAAGDKEELREVIEHYHRGYAPLIVPIALLKHYVRKFDEPYLRKQYYLDPHPIELMLRNHA
jgi:uncharacterized protein YbgA (DUF1722 family)/uncharacterized protein YbbK (DUF523 family)